ncbi:MAG: hypothetical protein KJ070_22230 [Verrucomicrobia bacterium]|nr:hypothetical protein [Verrucomicrobiota bacterium]
MMKPQMQDSMTLRSGIRLVAILMLATMSPGVGAGEREISKWAQFIREQRAATVLCERTVFDEAGEKPRDVKKHQFRRQHGALFFRSLADYADATNYANSRTMAAGHWENSRWAVQANDLYLTDAMDTNSATKSLVWVFGDLAQELADEVFCWGINADPATLVATSPGHFRASHRQAGWEATGEVIAFSDAGLPTKLICIFKGPSGPYRTNVIEYTFDPQAKLPCLPKSIRSFLVLGERQIPRVFLHIEEFQFMDSAMPRDQFSPEVFSRVAPFRFDLVTTAHGLFQRRGDELVKVRDASSAKPVGAKLRYLYLLLVLVAGGTLVLALRRRSTVPTKSSA